MSHTELWDRVVDWMNRHKWRAHTGKRRGFEQSLMDHALLEVDVLLQLAPILQQKNRWGLTPQETQLLAVALMAHDIGKALPEWQEYVLGRGRSLSDVNRALTASAVPHLYAELGLEGDGPVVQVILENCINLHMRHERTPANLIAGMLRAAPFAVDRPSALADLVFHIDNLCSIGNALGALSYLREKPIFAQELHAAQHQVTIRGVSTVMLHRAAQEAFTEQSWTPLLFFREGTVYVRSRAEDTLLPTRDAIRDHLSRTILRKLGAEAADLVVGSPTATMLPKPLLFDARETEQYLHIASRRIGRQSFLKKKEPDRRKVVASYLGISESAVAPGELSTQSTRIADAQPDMVVFKFFKAAMCEELVGTAGRDLACERFRDLLGEKGENLLRRTSTLMPARDMALVELFWKLPGPRFNRLATDLEELPAQERTKLLVQELGKIAAEAFATLPEPPSRTDLATTMAASFLNDLVTPGRQGDVAEIARAEMESYSASKQGGGRGRGTRSSLCSICNTHFERGVEALADYLEKPEAHTNRARAHGPARKLVICEPCTHERVLRQLLLEGRSTELLILTPRRMVGRLAGQRIVTRAEQIHSRMQAVMLGMGDDPDLRMTLGLPSEVMRRCRNTDEEFATLSPEEVADRFSYRSSEERRRTRRRDLTKRLREEFDDDLDLANVEWGKQFSDWDSAVEAVVANQVPDADQIRREVYGLQEELRLVCETPNFVLMPLRRPIASKDDSETNGALKRVFVELALAKALDCSAAIVGDSEAFVVPESEGIAWIPSIGPARRLLSELLVRLERRKPRSSNLSDTGRKEQQLRTLEWVPLEYSQDLFQAIGAAALLADQTTYPARHGLFMVLSAPTVGHVLRRIEQKSSTGRADPSQFEPLKLLEKVLG